MKVNFKNGDLVRPGQILGKISTDLLPGDGVVIRGNKFYAVLRGNANLSNIDKQNQQTVTVARDTKKRAGIDLGDEVLARVQKIKSETVFVNIVCVNGHPLSTSLEGVIKKKDVREKEIDKIKMEECFIPGDIIKAYVASYGDSRRIQLRTHEDDCGVLYARHQDSGNLMFPISLSEMICPITKQKELRKVAIPNLEDYEEQEK